MEFIYGFEVSTGLSVTALAATVQFSDLGGPISTAQLATGTPTAGQVPAFDGTQIVWTTPAFGTDDDTLDYGT